MTNMESGQNKNCKNRKWLKWKVEWSKGKKMTSGQVIVVKIRIGQN